MVGNIGNPILLEKNITNKTVFVIEASSYQLEYSKLFKSKISMILNISPDHLDRHKNINNYTKVKSKIFFGQNKSDYSYLNKSNQYSNKIKNIIKKNKIKSNLILVNKSNCNFLLKKINNNYFKGKGNLENLSFAYSIVKKLGVSNKVIIKLKTHTVSG